MTENKMTKEEIRTYNEANMANVMKVVIKKYEYPQNECIQMSVEYYDKTGGQTVTLPIFKKGTMYKGLESNKCYTLEELGL